MLEKEIKEFEGFEWEVYKVFLDDSLSYKDREIIVDIAGKHFGVGDLEEDVLDFYDNLSFRIKDYDKRCRDFVLKKGDLFFESVSLSSLWNENETKQLDFRFFKQRKKEDLIKYALSWTRNLIKQNSLSLGDRKIIRDLSLECLENNLEKLFQDDSEFDSLAHCYRIDLNEEFMQKIKSYGFDINNRMEGFKFDGQIGGNQIVDNRKISGDQENYFRHYHQKKE